MATKVTPRSDEDPNLASRRAAVLRFLVAAQRGRGVTLQSVANEHGTQRSNLSAYISSGGQRRCIALERLREALFSLGAHWDFTLRGRQFHRWDLGGDLRLVPGLAAILDANRVVRMRVLPTVGKWEAFVAFVAVEAEGEAICLIRAQEAVFADVCACFGFAPDQPVVEAPLSDAVQSAWLTRDPNDATTAVRKLLMATPAPKKQPPTAERRVVTAS